MFSHFLKKLKLENRLSDVTSAWTVTRPPMFRLNGQNIWNEENKMIENGKVKPHFSVQRKEHDQGR